MQVRKQHCCIAKLFLVVFERPNGILLWRLLCENPLSHLEFIRYLTTGNRVSHSGISSPMMACQFVYLKDYFH